MKIPALLILLTTMSNTALGCEKSTHTEADFPESLSQSKQSEGISSAWYDGGTGRYRHGVLGDAIEPSILRVSDHSGCSYSIELGRPHVYEDIQTRLANIDGKPGAEVVTIRSHQDYGAQIAVYQLAEGSLELLTTTPYIGTSNRWLAPVGIADFNADGAMDIAFVDRPHLAKTLRVWTYRDGTLEQIASKAGYSNHKIGEDFISGGIKTCDGEVIMVTADAYWTRVLGTTLQDSELVSVDLGPFNGTDSFDSALSCE